MSLTPPAPPVALDPALSTRRAEHAPPSAAGNDDRAAALMNWALLAFVLVLGVPIFLCGPVWFDISHYDICARKLLRGGVLYRDVFDNNLPGIIWLQTGVRLLFGWGSGAIRLADLIFYSVGATLLLRWLPRGSRVGTAAALFAFYLFVPESCPCQRDIWMFLPAVVGLTLRRQQVRRLGLASPSALALVGCSVLEGLVWGSAVWIKPFVFVPALACWLAGFVLLRRSGAGRGRLLTADAAGLLGGGILAGGLGLLWLWRSGSWPYFWEIFLDWNRDYAGFSNRVRFGELSSFLIAYLPWSLVAVAACWLAVKEVHRQLLNHPAPASGAEPGQGELTLLAAFFLGWGFQALFLQLPHDYALIPMVSPATVLLAARWRWPKLSSRWVRAAWMGVVMLLAFCWAVAFMLYRVVYWPDCLREGSTPYVQSKLATRRDNPYGPDTKALSEVADYLRGQGARDGEVTCLSGCTHPLYLALDLEPPTRFPQIEMTTLFFTHHRDVVLADLNASRQRYVVTDLAWTGLSREGAEETNPDDPLALPSEFPEEFVGVYPWTEPIVFRSGRYLVHRVTGPATPFWREDHEDPPKWRFKNCNEYLPRFEGKMSFRDEEAARASLAVIDDLYRESEQAGDRAGQHQATLKALSMADQAHWAGKEREAEVFRHWLRQKLGEGAGR